jgi:hypothetical protein
MNFLIFVVLPLGITTLLLAAHARWAWLRTEDKILRGMKLDEVLRRAEFAKTHRLLGGIHSLFAIPALLITLVLGAFWIYPNDFSGAVALGMFAWIYGLYIPHILAIYLYHLRWNPKTVARKRKLDDEDYQYQGDYRLRDGMQYRLGEDGELVEVEEEEAEEIAR